MTGNPYGPDAFKYGTADNKARRDIDEANEKKSTDAIKRDKQFNEKRLNQSPSSGTSRSWGGGSDAHSGFGKLLAAAVGVLIAIGYFGSRSNTSSQSGSSPRADFERRLDEARKSSSVGSVRSSASPPSSEYTKSVLRLPEGDHRVAALVSEIATISSQVVFVTQGGDLFVVDDHTPPPGNYFTQAAFNLADLDLHRSAYLPEERSVSLVCRNNEHCITGSIYEGTTEQTAGQLQRRAQFGSVNVLSSSEDDAQRILADLQQLQSLER